MVVYCSVLRLEAKSFQNLPLKFAVTTDDTVAQLTFRVSLDTGSVTLLRTLSYAIDQHRFQFNLSVTEQYSNYVTYALVILSGMLQLLSSYLYDIHTQTYCHL